MQKTFHIIGLMSGTSLDGLDLAHCTFTQTESGYSYQINAAETFPYSAEWEERLAKAHLLPASDYFRFHSEYGQLLGLKVKEFLAQHPFPVDYIASHGHTIFHQPSQGFTVQAGSGANLAIECGYPVICDFRTSDVAAGGQGAPLVPIGDRMLFGDYAFCLNLGGFANISFETEKGRIAYDICPVNFVMNALAARFGQPYDTGGSLAASGSVIPGLLEQLNNQDYYHAEAPKSLGREWVEQNISPLMDPEIPGRDLLRTYTEHTAIQIGRSLAGSRSDKVLLTGGGARNEFLVGRIRQHSVPRIVIPDPQLIDFKEALIFAFLGLLRIQGIPNCLASVTGASKDMCGGTLYLP